MARRDAASRIAKILVCALWSGGLGAIHVGMLAEPLPPAFVHGSGVSADAINGSLYAHPSADTVARGRTSIRQWVADGGLNCGDFPNQLAIHSQH